MNFFANEKNRHTQILIEFQPQLKTGLIIEIKYQSYDLDNTLAAFCLF